MSRFRVSSKHLALASDYFERRLKECWAEGKELSKMGKIDLELTDTEPDVLLILLNIIHGRTRRIPRRLDLDTLTEFADLVDYFQCLEVVEVFGNMWIQELKNQAMKRAGTETIQWIFISWIFRDSVIFGNVARKAWHIGTDNMDTLALPIPSDIKGK